MFLTHVRNLVTFESDGTFDPFRTFSTFQSAESPESRPGRKPDEAMEWLPNTQRRALLLSGSWTVEEQHRVVRGKVPGLQTQVSIGLRSYLFPC